MNHLDYGDVSGLPVGATNWDMGVRIKWSSIVPDDDPWSDTEVEAKTKHFLAAKNPPRIDTEGEIVQPCTWVEEERTEEKSVSHAAYEIFRQDAWDGRPPPKGKRWKPFSSQTDVLLQKETPDGCIEWHAKGDVIWWRRRRKATRS